MGHMQRVPLSRHLRTALPDSREQQEPKVRYGLLRQPVQLRRQDKDNSLGRKRRVRDKDKRLAFDRAGDDDQMGEASGLLERKHQDLMISYIINPILL